MQFIEADPLPMVCQTCEDRKNCLAQGEGEWCCDECDHLVERFISVWQPLEVGKKGASRQG